MNGWVETIATALACASVVFGAVVLLRLRHAERRVLELEMALLKISAVLPKNARKALRQPGRRIEVSVEGREIEILKVGGQEMVCFQDDLSEDERDRILAYLRDEGFIS